MLLYLDLLLAIRDTYVYTQVCQLHANRQERKRFESVFVWDRANNSGHGVRIVARLLVSGQAVRSVNVIVVDSAFSGFAGLTGLVWK